ncbi:MAG TPA: MarC family protein [Rhizomicrobium sp.]|nr:MarC family protein [Rhizomicrobium sp.]
MAAPFPPTGPAAMQDIFLTALATLFVAVGPMEVAPVFLALTAGTDRAGKLRIATIAAVTASVVLLAFAFGGNQLLALLGVGLPAFRTAGGILLLMVAADLLLAKQHSGMTSITPNEEREARGREGIAVVPLAIPLIAGPGSMTAIVLLMGKVHTIQEGLPVLAALALVMAFAFFSMVVGDRLMRVLGITGANALARVSGILLAALAMQFIFDGLSASGLFH